MIETFTLKQLLEFEAYLPNILSLPDWKFWTNRVTNLRNSFYWFNYSSLLMIQPLLSHMSFCATSSNRLTTVPPFTKIIQTHSCGVNVHAKIKITFYCLIQFAFLAHLSWKLKWTFLITCCPSSFRLSVR